MFVIKADVSGFNYYLRITDTGFNIEGLIDNATQFKHIENASTAKAFLKSHWNLSIQKI